MGIRVSTPSGATIEFPDGTDEQTISKVMAEQGGGPKPSTGNLAALAEGGAQGLTFGFADEIEGAGRAVIGGFTGDNRGFGDRYAEGRDKARERAKQARESNPLAYYGGEIAGGVALPFGAARIAGKAAAMAPRLVEPVAGIARTAGFGQLAANANAGLGARTIAGLREGAAYGAAYGLGQGEGGVADQAASLGKGAVLGGAFGAAAPAIVDGVSAVARGVTTPIRAAMQPQQVGREKLAEALVRDVAQQKGGAPGELEALNRISGRMEAAQDAGKNVMLADVGGENTRNLVRASSNVTSTGREALRKTLDSRQANQWTRIEKDLAQGLPDASSFYDDIAGLKGARKQAANTAFSSAYSQPVRPQAAAEIRDFIEKRPYMQTMYDRTVASITGKEGEQAAQTIQQKPWELLHRLKIQMDREINKLRKGQPDAATNWDASDLIELKNTFNDMLKKHNGPYRKAMGEFADESSIINAAEDGLEMFKSSAPAELKAKIKQLTASSKAEADAFRKGAAQSLIKDIEGPNVNIDRTDKIFGSPAMQKKLEALFEHRGDLRRFQRALILEAKMSDTRKAVQGGSTTARQLAEGDEAGQPMRMAVSAAQAATTGRLEPVLNLAGRAAQRFSGLTPATANTIAEGAMMKDTKEVKRAFGRAIRQAQRRPGERARVARGLLAGAAAGSSGQ